MTPRVLAAGLVLAAAWSLALAKIVSAFTMIRGASVAILLVGLVLLVERVFL